MDEVAQIVRHAVSGISINDETLSEDVIKEIGIGKDFIRHDIYFRDMRLQSVPGMFDRRVREEWKQVDQSDIYKKATEKVSEVLGTHSGPTSRRCSE